MRIIKLKKAGIYVIILLLLADIISANPFSRALDIANSIFASEGYRSYSRLIDFIVFFIIFTVVSLIGLKSAFKDKGVNNHVKALAVAIGFMSSIALIYGGTLFGREISIATMFPFVLGFLGFILILLPIYWIINLLTGQKHKVLSFLLALLITGVLAFLLLGYFGGTLPTTAPSYEGRGIEIGGRGSKITVPGFGKKAVKKQEVLIGYFAKNQRDIFATKDGRTKTNQNEDREKILEFAKKCRVHIETSATNDERNNIDKGRCLYIMSIATDNDLGSDCEKDEVKAYETFDSTSPSDRYYKLRCVGEGGTRIEKELNCEQLTKPGIADFIRISWDEARGQFNPEEEKSKLERLELAYKKCKAEFSDGDPDAMKRFYDITLEYHMELASAWFAVGEYVKAFDAVDEARIDIGGRPDDVIVPSTPFGDKLLDFWHDKLIYETIIKREIYKVNAITDHKRRVDEAAKLKKTVKRYKTMKDKRHIGLQLGGRVI